MSEYCHQPPKSMLVREEYIFAARTKIDQSNCSVRLTTPSLNFDALAFSFIRLQKEIAGVVFIGIGMLSPPLKFESRINETEKS
jgi:hypothetical protein